MKRIEGILVVSTLLLILLSSGCSIADTTNGINSEANINTIVANTQDGTSESISVSQIKSVQYIPTVIKAVESSVICSLDTDGDNIIYCTQSSNSGTQVINILDLYCDIESTIDLAENQFISGISSIDDNYLGCFIKEHNENQVCNVIKIMNTSGEITDYELQIDSEMRYVSMLFNGDDLYLLLWDGSSYFLNAYRSENQIGSIKLEEEPSDIIKIGHDVYCIYQSENTTRLLLVNSSEFALEDAITINSGYSTKLFGSIKDEFYISENGILYVYDMITGEKTEIINWTKISIEYENIAILKEYGDDGIIIGINNASNFGCRIILLAPESTNKQVLTLAVLTRDIILSEAVFEFNSKSDEYYIEVVDYTSETGDSDTALTKMDIELSTGSSCDIYYLEGLSSKKYENIGAFLDLKPYIESDEQLSVSGFVGNLFSLIENNGSIFQAVSNFSLSTIIGAKSDIGDRSSWSLDELDDYANSDNRTNSLVFGSSTTRDAMFMTLCRYNMSELVDWEKGTCSFENELFYKILEFCKQLPADEDMRYTIVDTPTLFKNGQQRLVVLDNFERYYMLQMYSEMLYGELSFIGFPSDINNGSAFRLRYGVAISSKSDQTEGAWQFARMLLSEEYQTAAYGDGETGFPTNRKAFDTLMKYLVMPFMYFDEYGNEVGKETYISWGDYEVQLRPATDDEINTLTGLINDIDTIYWDYHEILDILTDDTQYYFYGSKSASEVAKIIQNRVQIYLSEIS